MLLNIVTFSYLFTCKSCDLYNFDCIYLYGTQFVWCSSVVFKCSMAPNVYLCLMFCCSIKRRKIGCCWRMGLGASFFMCRL